MVSKFYDGIDMWNDDYKITKLTYEVRDDGDFPSSYYIENDLTASHVVEVTYEINGDEKEPRVSRFSVPREIDGVFIIAGSYRMATNRLNKDYECCINLEGSGERYINFDYNRKFNVDNNSLHVRRTNKDLGIQEKALDLSYDKLDEAIEDPTKAEFLKLTERQSKKLQIKLDLDYYPEYITRRLIDDCIAFGDDRVKDLVIDKTIESVPRNFMQFLFRSTNGKPCNYYSVRRRMVENFAKFNFISEDVASITNLCLRFWKGGKDIKNDLQISPGINALNLQSYTTKITIDKSVAYNNTMSDLIDLADTPINGNVGVQNALTVSCHPQDDGSILFDVYSKDFQRITIDYLDYLNSKVVASEYVNYENNTLKPNDQGEVEVKYRMKRKMVKVEDIDLIDLHPDYRLSSTSRQIPFVNYTDSVRIMMGGSMSKQTIPLPNGQKPLVASGNTEELTNNTLNEHCNFEAAKVKSITDDEIIIEEAKTGNIKVYPRRTALQGLNNVDIFNEPKVKVGQKLKKGDVIIGPHELDVENGYKMGLNTLVLYGPHHGLTNEDAVVVSESYADRMSHYSFVDISIDVKNSDAIHWIAPIGTAVKSQDSVVTINHAVQLNAVNKLLQDKLTSLVFDSNGNGINTYVTEKKLTVPNNIDEAVVADVFIQEKPKERTREKIDWTFAETGRKYAEDYEKTKDRKIIYEKYPEYIASDKLKPASLEQKKPNVLFTIRVRLIKRQRLVCGSKISNRFGGKGVISAIEPDEKMPILVDANGVQKRVELIMNPYSTINRKIPSVIMEIGCANCIVKLHDMVEKYKSTATGKKKIMPLIKKYYPGKYDDLDVDEFIKLHNSKPLEDVYAMNVGSYSTYTPDKIQEMMDDLGVTTQSKVLYPALELMDLPELKETLGDEEYEKIVSENRGKYREVKRPLMAGYVTMIELYHMPMYSNKCTTDMADSQRYGVIAPRGAFRTNGGQKIGEMELWALLSRNAKGFIHASRESVEVEQNQRFLNNLLGLGLMINDESGYPQGGSNLKSSLEKMKQKFKFRNGGVIV